MSMIEESLEVDDSKEDEQLTKNKKHKDKSIKKELTFRTIYVIFFIIVFSYAIYNIVSYKRELRELRREIVRKEFKRISLEKVEKFFTESEYKSLIEFHTSIMQKIDLVSKDNIFSDETTSRLRRLYSSELDRINFLSNNLTEFKANSKRIKQIVKNRFIEEICKALDIKNSLNIKDIDFSDIIAKIKDKIEDKIIDKLKEEINIKSERDFKNSIKNDLKRIKNNFDIPPKNSIIRSFANNNFVQYSTLGLSLINLGFTIYDTIKKIEAIREIVKKNYEYQFTNIKNDFSDHINQIKNIKKIDVNSSNEEIEIAINDFKSIIRDIEGDQRNIISLIDDIRQEIKKMEQEKNYTNRKTACSIACSIFCIAAAIVTMNPLPLVGAAISAASTAIDINNLKNCNEALDYLREVLESSQELKSLISETINLISKIITELQAKMKDNSIIEFGIK